MEDNAMSDSGHNSQIRHAQTEGRPMTPVELQMYEDLLWARSKPDFEQKYFGECIVVWKKQVIAHGKNEEEVLEQVKAGDWPFEEVVVVDYPDFFEIPH
jgi:hypothetical protein